MSVRRVLLLAVSAFSILSIYMIIQHEQQFSVGSAQRSEQIRQYLRRGIDIAQEYERNFMKVFDSRNISSQTNSSMAFVEVEEVETPTERPIKERRPTETSTEPPHPTEKPTRPLEKVISTKLPLQENMEKRGNLQCDGKFVDSEVIYWKVVPGDDSYESPITPHHGIHHDRYLSYEYDEGGWNNIRMGMECLIVLAHAMGRTLIIPPPQHLYLLNKGHIDPSGKEKRQMGFEDFFDLSLLESQKGFHMLTTSEFLKREAVVGGLNGKYPPDNRTDLWGRELAQYLRQVADKRPHWSGKYVVMPNATLDIANFNANHFDLLESKTLERLKAFGGDRSPVFYDRDLQEAHHIHFEAGQSSRILQHHYAFSFFVDREMQSFYRRFVRDYMRYKDYIQCAGMKVLAEVRKDALAHSRGNNSNFYALHIRRGDFQFKEVKLGADDILKNLVVDGIPVIPPGSLVYLSTDDPKGVCENCMVQRIPCDKYEKGKKPPGCPEDPSWNAFVKYGWTLRFLDDYISRGTLEGVNPNVYGMVESIICSRAKVFAGTYFSTFTGYIHRLRGYHGLGEDTYYHSTGRVTFPRMKKSVGHGFSREWRAGWTDDGGELI